MQIFIGPKGNAENLCLIMGEILAISMDHRGLSERPDYGRKPGLQSLKDFSLQVDWVVQETGWDKNQCSKALI